MQWEYWGVLGGVLRDPSSHGQGPCAGTELKDFLPMAPLPNQISFFKKMLHLRAPMPCLTT